MPVNTYVPDVVRELEIIVDQMKEWIEELGPIVKAGGPFQPMQYFSFCCGVRSAFEGMVSTASETLAKHEKEKTEPVTVTVATEPQRAHHVDAVQYARDQRDLLAKVLEGLCDIGQCCEAANVGKAHWERCEANNALLTLERWREEDRAADEKAKAEPVTITFWSEGAPVIHDVVGIPPGISIVFHDLDCESAGDDAEIKNDPQMGDYFVFGPYTATT